MKIKILDYRDRPQEVDVGELESIKQITISIISGDEILDVEYFDSNTKIFDSCGGDRILDFYDGNYILYSEEESINRLNDPRWLNRENSYSFPSEYID